MAVFVKVAPAVCVDVDWVRDAIDERNRGDTRPLFLFVVFAAAVASNSCRPSSLRLLVRQVHVLGDSLVFRRHDFDFVAFGHAFIRQPLRPRPTVAAFRTPEFRFRIDRECLVLPLDSDGRRCIGGKGVPTSKRSAFA